MIKFYRRLLFRERSPDEWFGPRPLVGWWLSKQVARWLYRSKEFDEWLPTTPWWFRRLMRRVFGVFRFYVSTNFKITTPAYGRWQVIGFTLDEARGEWWVHREWIPTKFPDVDLREIVMANSLRDMPKPGPTFIEAVAGTPPRVHTSKWENPPGIINPTSIRRIGPWADYPLGTKAVASNGGHWIKVETGWKWHCGDVFPTPGGDVAFVITP